MGMKALFCVPLLLVVGCIHKPVARHPMGASATSTQAPDPAQVASCEKTRTWHNVWILSGTVFGGVASSGGAADALTTNKNVQTGVGVGVIAAGILAATSAAAAGITADTYATGNCQQILQQSADAAPPPSP